MRIWWIYDAIVHPFTFSACANDACPPQVRQMPRYFGLTLSEYFHEEAYAYFVIPDKVEQAQPRLVSQRAKQLVHIELHSLFGHAVDSSSEHIRLALCIEPALYCHTFGQAYVSQDEPEPWLEGEKSD